MNDKIDLTPSLKRPLDPTMLNRDVSALNNLVRELNDPRLTGAEVPAGEDVKAHATPIAVPPSVAAVPAPVTPRDISQVFYTGRIGVGKDYVASATGATVFGMADPIYHLLNFLTNTKTTVDANQGKDLPGVRATLQTLGQWGRGTITAAYPISVDRLVFEKMVQSISKTIDPGNKLMVRWDTFGVNENIWLESLVARIEAFRATHPESRVAVTNVRFENEYKFLLERGFKHYHVMCSAATWVQRLAAQKIVPESPVLKDLSEKLANAMDADVIHRLSKQPTGGVLRVIWNDSQKCPSTRLLTLAQYLQEASM